MTNPKNDNKGVHYVTYHGWNNSVEILNDQVRVVVVPAIGRIMSYGFRDGENLLYNNPAYAGKTLAPNQPYKENGMITWANFGGDKVWPTQQTEWPKTNARDWPPDHWFDGSAHTARLLENGVEMTGPVSDYCGARSIRQIILDPHGTAVTIHQKIEKIKKAQVLSSEPISYTIWNVTQIVPPQQALLNLNPDSRFTQKYYPWESLAAANFSVDGAVGVFVPDRVNPQKAGCDSMNWLGAIIGDVVIGEFFRCTPGANYPDGGLSAEVYTCPDYTELELLSPFAELAVNEQTEYTIIWDVKKLPAGLEATQKRNQAVQWLNEHIIP